MHCTNCGAPLEEGALFCRKCGTSVPETPETSPFTDVKPKEKGSPFTDRKPGKKHGSPDAEPKEKTPSPFADTESKEKTPSPFADAEPKEKTPSPFADAEPKEKTPSQLSDAEPETPIVLSEPEPEEKKPERAPKRIRERKAPKQLRLPDLKALPRKTRLMLLGGAAARLLIVLTVVIVSAVSCGKAQKFASPDAVKDAVIDALNRGDGERLAALAKVSAPFLGKHPETYGEGDTPEAVMRGYYKRTVNDLRTKLVERFGKDCTLEGAIETKLLSGSEIFETNRALGLEAPQYAEMTGPLTVNGETVASLRIVAAELDGEWKLIAAYVD